MIITDSFEVGSYGVVVQHQQNRLGYKRISLEPTLSYSGPIERASLFFSFSENPQNAGYRADWELIVLQPPATFDATYDILRNEQPVYFNWQRHSSSDDLLWTQIGTKRGYVDRGPTEPSPTQPDVEDAGPSSPP